MDPQDAEIQTPPLKTEQAKAIFWDRYDYYTAHHSFTPWVTTLLQSVLHGICRDYRDYPHTRASIDLDVGVKRALELQAFLSGVTYKRYENPGH